MRKHLGLIVLAGLVVAVFAMYLLMFQVDSTQWAMTLKVGRVQEDRVYDGSIPDEAGLKFKLPAIETVKTYEARLMILDDVSSELSTADGQLVLVAMSCFWRIDDPVVFSQQVKTVKQAEASLKTMLQDARTNVIGQHRMDELVNTDPAKMRLEVIEQEVQDAMVTSAKDNYGVEIVMIGVQSVGLPETTTVSVIAAMNAQQEAKIEELSQNGASAVAVIRALAEDAQIRILAFADAQAAKTEAEGSAAAGPLYAQFDEAPEFAMFLRWLESLEKELSTQTTFVLDGDELMGINLFSEGADADLSPGR
jgi:modulator of FtsH protease HflC